MNGACDVSNLETCKDLAVLSRLTVINSRKSESNICVKEGRKKIGNMQWMFIQVHIQSNKRLEGDFISISSLHFLIYISAGGSGENETLEQNSNGME